MMSVENTGIIEKKADTIIKDLKETSLGIV